MAQLFVLSGPDAGRSFDLGEGDTIGRDPTCAIVLRDKGISRRHAHLERSGDGWAVVDDGSRNGILVDGARVQRAGLADLAEFQLGEVLLRFRDQPATEPASARASVELEPEIRLEEEPELELGEGGALPAPREKAAAHSAAPLSATRAAPRAAGAMPRGAAEAARGILQYHRIEDRGGGLLSGELSQRPMWLRWCLYALALLVAAAAFYAAFFGGAFLRDRIEGSPAEGVAPGEEAR